jgi:predicted GH43/DUF377 family glycosyl hydrolase
MLALVFLLLQPALPAWALGPFIRDDSVDPLFSPNPHVFFQDPIQNTLVPWQATATFNPASVVYANKLDVLFRAEDDSGNAIGEKTSRIGIAESGDGLHFRMSSNPIVYPQADAQRGNEWPGGCEDPRVVESSDGIYVMTYTQWNRKLPRLAVATSRDLLHWDKEGPAFAAAYGGKFAQIPTKSASIVTELVSGRQLAVKVDSKYMMLWGEEGVNVATSDDLIHWTPTVNEKGDLVYVFQPRPHFFDSDLTECGPPAVLTRDGIVLMYNGKNASGAEGDPNYGADAYCAGEVLLSKSLAPEVLSRLDKPVFVPSRPYEKTGQYVAGTVFTEGLTFFHHKWFLYYGCADSKVAVAIYTPDR